MLAAPELLSRSRHLLASNSQDPRPVLLFYEPLMNTQAVPGRPGRPCGTPAIKLCCGNGNLEDTLQQLMTINRQRCT